MIARKMAETDAQIHTPQRHIAEGMRGAHGHRGPLRRSLGGANERVIDALSKEEGDAVCIQAPHQGSDTERGPVRRDDLQAHDNPLLERCAGPQFRSVLADVHDLAGKALAPRFDPHGPGDSSAGMLASIPRLRAGHGPTLGNSRARNILSWTRVVRDGAAGQLSDSRPALRSVS
jgi:hypothetical protein